MLLCTHCGVPVIVVGQNPIFGALVRCGCMAQMPAENETLETSFIGRDPKPTPCVPKD